jgi:hypothetical protein
MKFGKTSLARRLPKQNTGLVFGGEQVTSATEPAEGVVICDTGRNDTAFSR